MKKLHSEEGVVMADICEPARTYLSNITVWLVMKESSIYEPQFIFETVQSDRTKLLTISSTPGRARLNLSFNQRAKYKERKVRNV